MTRTPKPAFNACDTLAFQIKAVLKIDVAREYKFHPVRKWPFDLALVSQRIAIEINGGIWRRGGGAHTGVGHLRDMEKFNEAQLMSWTVYQFTPDQVKNGEAMRFIERALVVRHLEATA